VTLRLLPFVIAVAGVALALRLGGLLHDIEAVAEEKPAVAAPLASFDEPAAAAEAGPDEQLAGKTEAPLYDLPADPLQMSDQEIELLQALSQRRQEIEQRAAAVEQRAALLAAAETRIEEKIGRLESLQAQIEALLVEYDAQEEKQIESLVKIYESMKPKDAARIFEKLEMDVLLSVVQRMKERKTAPVLAAMDADRAQEVTLELATRRELPVPRD
jgi:flagellar motility protein MotE (MotC chaperone)